MVSAFFHQPLGGARGTTNANGLYASHPLHVDLLGTLYLVTIGINTLAFVEKHLSVAALSATDKQNEVVARGKIGYVGHAVGHLSADGVEASEGSRRRDMLLYIVDDAMKLVEALGGLRVKIDVAFKSRRFTSSTHSTTIASEWVCPTKPNTSA